MFLHVSITATDIFKSENNAAWGYGTISKNTVTIPLLKEGSSSLAWTGTGQYVLYFSISPRHDPLIYTNGKAWKFGDTPPRYNITGTTSTIDWALFKEYFTLDW
jgi:hypothetical protein